MTLVTQQKGPVRPHADYSPSAAPKWMRCSMYITEVRKRGQGASSAAALEGTLAHSFCDYFLTTESPEGWNDAATRAIGEKIKLDGYDEPQLLTREMAEGVQEYLDECLTCGIQGGDYWVESRVHIPSKWTDGIWGTSDFFHWNPVERVLTVKDFKYGFYHVDLWKNPNSLALYALGAMAKLKVVPKWIKLTIVQPRDYHRSGTIRSRMLSLLELVAFAIEVDTAVYAIEHDPKYEPGQHCRYCVAAWNCEALHNYAFRGVPAGKLPRPKDMSMDQLKDAMDAAADLELWIREVRAEANARLAADPNSIPGYKLVERLAKRKWDGEDVKLAEAIAAEFGLQPEALLRKKLMGITDTEKLVFKGKRGEERRAAERSMSKFTVRDSSGYEVAPVDDDRPAASVVEDSFAGVRIPAAPADDDRW